MKNLFFICFILLSNISLSYSENNNDIDNRGSISGTVLDAKLKQPLPYVNVIIKNENNVTLTGGITLDDGSFKIEKIADGNIVVSIQYIGYKTFSKKVNITKGNYKVNLGNIYLEEEAESLDAVTVVAETSTIQQKVDRKVITIGKDLTTAGATASDIMNNIPSVNVDQQTGNISLRGNENVRVMVDGKLTNVPIAQLLRQIPSTSIKQIELITNPSAKYNPEGMSGIINIKLHKNTKLGFNGNLNVGLTKEIFAKFNSSIDMNYRNGKFNFYGNYGNNIGNNDNFGEINRLDDNSRQDFKFGNNNKSHLYKLGVDFYMNDNNTISFFTNQNIFNGAGFGNTLITYTNLEQQQLFKNKTKNNSGQYNLAFKHKFKNEDETLDLELDYNDFERDEIANFDFVNFNFPPNYVDDVDTKRDRTTINLDYVKPLNDKEKLELGAEVRLFNSDIDYESTGLSFDSIGNTIQTPSTVFDYSRNIYSVYVSYGKTINEKWNYQVGARAEQVFVDAEPLQLFNNNTSLFSPFENNYFQIYPSVFLSYSPSEKKTFQFSMSRRVDRPGLQQVNPIREWSTPRVSSFGNPELVPQFTNSAEFNFTKNLKNGSITSGVFFRLIEDNINRFVRIDRADITTGNVILSFDNFDSTTAFGIELSSNYRPTKWWSLNGSFDLYSQTQTGITEFLDLETNDYSLATIDDIKANKTEVNNVVWNLRLFNNFKASKKLSFSLFTMYRGEEKGIQFTRKPMFMVNTGMRYSFLPDNRATFSVNYSDIFNTMMFEFEANNPFPGIGAFNWESNTWNIALAYRFGGGNYRALRRKQRDSNTKSSGGGFL